MLIRLAALIVASGVMVGSAVAQDSRAPEEVGFGLQAPGVGNSSSSVFPVAVGDGLQGGSAVGDGLQAVPKADLKTRPYRLLETAHQDPQQSQPPKQEAPAPDEKVDLDAAVDTGESGLHFVWKQHPSIRYGSTFRLDFQAKFHVDAYDSYSGAQGALACDDTLLPTTCTWELHRSRIGIQGHLFREIEYEVEYELREHELTEEESLEELRDQSVWKDVFVNVRYIRNAQIQAGRFKIPFGLDQLIGVTQNDFVYRSMGATYLDPSRDTGVMVHGRFFKRGLNYWVGGFRHDGDNARSRRIQGGDQTFAARVTGTPFRKLSPSALGGLELGTAYTFSKLSDDSFRPNGLRGRTVLTEDVFYSPVYVKGDRQRFEADVDWTIGPASARTEYTRVTDSRLEQGLGDQTLPDARAQSWYVAGTWVITGEPKRRPVKAAHPLPGGGFGAVEVAARYERLWFDSVGATGSEEPFRNPRAENIFPTGTKAFTIGVNWTVNAWIKVQVNGIRQQVEDSERNPMVDGGAFWSQVVRFQFLL
jgi:phosphate-selective porin